METREILTRFKNGELSIEEAEHYFRKEPFEEMDDYAKAGFAQRNQKRISGSDLLQREGRSAFCAYFPETV